MISNTEGARKPTSVREGDFVTLKGGLCGRNGNLKDYPELSYTAKGV